ncbi:LYR motif-containing protein 2 [Geranomyces variabilis]|nr:LYR motif-containing protein 2 [Geranomyces variabilis]KAJ3143331.1 LYR motif-containing protein 2 [Geranomyces variabilis]KAJ3156982.1 LYR motif-containing protein 2 [Geranomyces variabilis]KAJ3166890.1 LYR motif-containing protein 2 [Geranomyces variabilis]
MSSSAAPRVSRLAARLKGPVLTLDQFMTRKKVLQLYRDILRNAKYLPETDARFVKDWARADFERYRGESNSDNIQMLLSQGKVQLRTLENSVTLSKAKFG